MPTKKNLLIDAKVRILVGTHKGKNGYVVLEYPSSVDVSIGDSSLERDRILSYKKYEIEVIEHFKIDSIWSEEPTNAELDRAVRFLRGSRESKATQALAREFAHVRLDALALTKK